MRRHGKVPMDRVIFVESAEKNRSGGGNIWKWAEVFTDEEARLITFFRSLRPESGSQIVLPAEQSAQLRKVCRSSTEQAIAVAVDDVFSADDLFTIDRAGFQERQTARDYLRSLGPVSDPS
jgi:hypothetical protein